MNYLNLCADWSNFIEKETDLGIKIMGEAVSASTLVLNTVTASGAEMYRHAKALHKSRQQFLKSFAPFL